MRNKILLIIFSVSVISFLFLPVFVFGDEIPPERTCECNTCYTICTEWDIPSGIEATESEYYTRMCKHENSVCNNVKIFGVPPTPGECEERNVNQKVSKIGDRPYTNCRATRNDEPYCCCKLFDSHKGVKNINVEELCNEVTGVVGMECNEYIYNHPTEGRPGVCICEENTRLRVRNENEDIWSIAEYIFALPFFSAQRLAVDHTLRQIKNVNQTMCEYLDSQKSSGGCRWQPRIITTSEVGVTYRAFQKDAQLGCRMNDVSTGQDFAKSDKNFADVERLRDAAKGLNVMNFTSVEQIIGRFVKMLLAFIGSIALVLYIWAGINWMTAMGNTEKVESAKKIMIWTTLGVAVMLGSYVLVEFVLRNLR